MNRNLLWLAVGLIALLNLWVGCGEANAGERNRNRACRQNACPGGQQPASHIVPYTAYPATQVGCFPPLGGFTCNYQNSGYQTQAYKGFITILP